MRYALSQKEESQPGQEDPIVVILRESGLAATVKNYLEAAYPDQSAEELMQDAEVMQLVDQALGNVRNMCAMPR